MLRNLTYANDATEPTLGMRMIEITVFDGVYSSNTHTIVIAIMLINDNNVRIEVRNSTLLFEFLEGAPELRVAQDAMVALIDSDNEISSLEISLSNQLDQSETIRISNDTSASVYTNGTYLFVNGTMSVSMYQVSKISYQFCSLSLYPSPLQALLNSLTYIYVPPMGAVAGNRTVIISASDGTSVATVTITIQVEIGNEHDPVVDLNGPNIDGINYSTSVQFNYVTLNVIEIATPNVTISDRDADAFISRLEVRLNEESADMLVLNLPNCTLPQAVNETSCHIM